MRPSVLTAFLAFVSVPTSFACEPTRPRSANAPPPQARAESALSVTSGRMDRLAAHRHLVDVPELRATSHRCGATFAELDFSYRGATGRTLALASGEVRQQLGLKLRAKDTCNVVYVMWRLEPERGVYVSVKRNPGQRTHDACGARGYVNLVPTATAALPHVLRDEAHTLRAEQHGDELRVFADGRIAWQGALPASLLDFDGPTGLRSDNVRYDFDLRDDGRETERCFEN